MKIQKILSLKSCHYLEPGSSSYGLRDDGMEHPKAFDFDMSCSSELTWVPKSYTGRTQRYTQFMIVRNLPTVLPQRNHGPIVLP